MTIKIFEMLLICENTFKKRYFIWDEMNTSLMCPKKLKQIDCEELISENGLFLS